LGTKVLLEPSSMLLASADVMPSLEASLLASPRRSCFVLVMCLFALQLSPRSGLSTSGVGVAAVVFFFAVVT
jgi:hypothetical protein